MSEAQPKRNGGFRCRKCASRGTQVTDSRPVGAFTTRRRRACKCGHRFTTFEIDAATYALISDMKKVSDGMKALTALLDDFADEREAAE